MRQLPLSIRLRERSVFDSFVAGANAAAVGQLRRLAERPSADVVWLCGPSGCGKSHLLQAACALAGGRGAEAAYLTLGELRAGGVETLSGWQDRRLLALDDLGRVAGEGDWEQALFALYLQVQERGAALIAAAEEPPRRLAFALPDLASRFAAATLLPLRPLDEDGQRQVLQLRTQARGAELPEDAARYLQRRFPRDLPTLCRLLDTVDEAALRAQRRLTVPFIRSVLLGEAPPSA